MINQVEVNWSGNQLPLCTGIVTIGERCQWFFSSALEDKTDVIGPKKTKLVPEESPFLLDVHYCKSLASAWWDINAAMNFITWRFVVDAPMRHV
jgi:hypothetical protein